MKILASIIFIVLLMVLLMNSTNSSPVPAQSSSTIIRVWHGWTTKENADAFEKTLTHHAIPSIEQNKPDGCLSIQLLRRDSGNEVEFTTLMTFNSMEAVKQFAGEDHEAAHVDPEVKPLLLRYDLRVAHYVTRYSKTC
jgi:heme-degrading monooxygenase HmoA